MSQKIITPTVIFLKKLHFLLLIMSYLRLCISSGSVSSDLKAYNPHEWQDKVLLHHLVVILIGAAATSLSAFSRSCWGFKQEAWLSQRNRAMFRVIECFAKSLEVVRK